MVASRSSAKRKAQSTETFATQPEVIVEGF